MKCQTSPHILKYCVALLYISCILASHPGPYQPHLQPSSYSKVSYTMSACLSEKKRYFDMIPQIHDVCSQPLLVSLVRYETFAKGVLSGVMRTIWTPVSLLTRKCSESSYKTSLYITRMSRLDVYDEQLQSSECIDAYSWSWTYYSYLYRILCRSWSEILYMRIRCKLS